MTHLRTLVLLVLSLCPINWMLAQASQHSALDSVVIHKKLPNGFSYFLYRDTAFKKQKISLRLAIKAGSLQETDAQRGYAHFVEHMGFNGTEHFSQAQLMHFFDKAGMQFGADANASTGFNHTSYRLDVPGDSLIYLQQALQIISDWAQGMSFLPAEVEREKGVILAERQMRENAQSRFQQLATTWFFQKDSLLFNRFPIGDSTLISQAKAEGLKEFYQKWYRPELMALVVVGDFDPDWIEPQIEQLFSEMPSSNPTVAMPSYKIQFAGQRQTFQTHEFPLPFSLFNLSLNIPKEVKRSPEGFLHFLALEHFISSLIELELQKNPISKTPGNNLHFGMVHDLGDLHYFQLSANSSHHTLPAIFRAALPPIIDLAKGNLSDARFVKLQKRLINEAEQFKLFDIKTADNAAEELAKLFAEAFLEDLPYSAQLDRWNLLPQIYANLQKAEVLELAQHWLDPAQQMLLLAHPPDAPKNAVQDSAYYWYVLDSLVTYHQVLADAAPLRPWFDTPLPSKVGIACQKDHAYDIREIQYTNGIKVAIKHLEGEPRIHFNARSYGGMDFIPSEHQVIGQLLQEVVQRSGVGLFNAQELAQRKVDLDLEHNLVFSHTVEHIGGSSQPEQFKDLMAMMYLHMSNPKFEQTTLDNLVQERMVQEKAEQLYTYNILEEFHSSWLHNPNASERKYSAEDIQKVKLEDLEKIYRERFCNPADFDFVIIGDLPLDSIQSIVDVYLGNLPIRITPRENYKINSAKKPDIRPIVPVDTTLYVFKEAKAAVEINYLTTWEGKYSPDYLRYFHYVDDLLESTLRQVIREDKSAVYHVSVQSLTNDWRTGIRIIFECDPERVKELEAVADSCIQNFINKAVLKEIFKKQQQHYNQLDEDNRPIIRDHDYWELRLQNDFDRLEALDYTPEDQLDPKSTFTHNRKDKAPSIQKFQRFWKRLIVPAKKSRIILLPQPNPVP